MSEDATRRDHRTPHKERNKAGEDDMHRPTPEEEYKKILFVTRGMFAHKPRLQRRV